MICPNRRNRWQLQQPLTYGVEEGVSNLLEWKSTPILIGLWISLRLIAAILESVLSAPNTFLLPLSSRQANIRHEINCNSTQLPVMKMSTRSFSRRILRKWSRHFEAVSSHVISLATIQQAKTEIYVGTVCKTNFTSLNKPANFCILIGTFAVTICKPTLHQRMWMRFLVWNAKMDGSNSIG